MRTKKMWWGMALIAVAALSWTGGGAWRARQGLVTLHVRNMPLAAVVRSIGGQTWKNIRAEKKLDALITLDVDDIPLAQALDLVAEQAGARWGRRYAIYSYGFSDKRQGYGGRYYAE